MTQTLSPQERINVIHKEYAFIYNILIGFGFVALGIWIGSYIFTDTNGYFTNVFTEIVSVIATIFVIDRINQWRADQQLKIRLLNELRSPVSATAVTALDWLRRENWIDSTYFVDSDFRRANWEGAFIGGLNFEKAQLSNVTLVSVTNNDDIYEHPINFRFANLKGANLSHASLSYSNFEKAKLWGANLSYAELEKAQFAHADLWRAELDKADIKRANFEGANLKSASLQNSDLWSSILTNANLTGVNLCGANISDAILEDADLGHARLECTILSHSDLSRVNLRGASLRGAYLIGANMNDIKWDIIGVNPTILPDSTEWSPDKDIERFTDLNHPEFEATVEKINRIRHELGYKPI